MKEYAYWTPQEEEGILNAVTRSKRSDGRVDWDAVAERMPSRNRQQCKSYFTNNLKKRVQVDTVQYRTWDADLERTLLQAVRAEGEDFTKI